MAILSAGNLLTVLKDGALGAICFGGIEVLRGVAFLVRDENWGTCAAKIFNLQITQNDNDFHVSYQAQTQNGNAQLNYQVSLTASERELVFHATAKPEQDFKTNRTGFVVLHSINGVAGEPLTITHTNGEVEQATFPKHIIPGQPFFDIRSLEHSPAPGLNAYVLMEGNKFEMEDQRNWSDASFKTYVCSLLDPWPYVLEAGKSFEQKITLRLSGVLEEKAFAVQQTPKSEFVLPEIGIAIDQAEALQALRYIEELREFSPQHLTCSLDGAEDCAAACEAYVKLANETRIPITLEIILPAREPAATEMARIAQTIENARLKPCRVVVTQANDLKSFQPTDMRPWGPSYEEMAQAARAAFPKAEIGGGMVSYFTELNRKRPPHRVFDFITHSICPIVHDASDYAVMQTLECLPQIFSSAKAFIGDTPYHLGPTSIGARLNPYGASLAQNPLNQRICLAPNDPRQFEEFAVSWNRGLINAAAEAGLKSITLSALTGSRGLINKDGQKSPLFHYLAKVLSSL